MRTLIVLFAALCLAASSARADEIRMKNGSTIYGKIVREDKDSVTIDLGRGRMDISRRNIITIVKIATPEPATPDAPPADAAPRPARRPTPPPETSTEEQATPPPRPAPPQPRKARGGRPAGPGPKVVQVERTQPAAPPTVEPIGPEATTPRKPAAKTTADETAGSASKSSSSRRARHDW